VSPHPDDLYGAFLVEHLIDEAMLDVNAARIGSCKIADQLLVGRWIFVRIVTHCGEERFDLTAESAGG
jgi:hypothetical protein